jgi:hypothetical protein
MVLKWPLFKFWITDTCLISLDSDEHVHILIIVPMICIRWQESSENPWYLEFGYGFMLSIIKWIQVVLDFHALYILTPLIRLSYAKFGLAVHSWRTIISGSHTVALQNWVQNFVLCPLNVRMADPSGRAGVGPLAWWDCGFKSRRGHGCLFRVRVVYCRVEDSVTGPSLIQNVLSNVSMAGITQCHFTLYRASRE